MRKITFFCCLLAFLACNKLESSPESGHTVCTQSTVIPLETALSYLDAFLQNTYPPTKSGEHKTYFRSQIIAFGKSDMEVITKAEAEKLNLPDTLVYLVNFNEGGYAVLSANKELETDGVLCLAEKGDFRQAFDGSVLIGDQQSEDFGDSTSTDETVDEDRELLDYEDDYDIIDEGESFVGTMIEKSIIGLVDISRGGEGQNGSSSDDQVRTNPNIGNVTSKYYGPYLKTKWTQGKPFNNFTPNNQLAGCGPIAAAQIILCNRKSKTMTFDGYDCNWDTLATVYSYKSLNYPGTVEAECQAGHFLALIGNGDNAKVKYGNRGTSAKAKNIQKTFRNFGYGNVKRYTGFGHKNRERAKAQIRNGKPVYLDALEKWSLKGHCFVLDGLLERTTASGERSDYVHINWGWLGKNDGYFRFDLLNPSERESTDPEVDTATSFSDNENTYSWDFRMVTYDL